MSELGNLDLEGRLNAQREVLSRVMARLVEGPGDPMVAALREALGVQNHQEDPGAVPHAAFAIEAAMTRELEQILEAALSLREQAG
jgi:hypothetical protein